eukprot:2743527-Karenia_brevis.AAC.1
MSTFDFNVKRHKENGEMTLRPIHTSSMLAASGLPNWVRFKLSGILNSIAPYIVRDAQDAKVRIQQLNLDFPVVFVRVDVGDDFLSGSHCQLTADIRSA